MLDEVSGDIDKSELHEFGNAILNGELYARFSDLIFDEGLYESNNKNYDKVIKYYQKAFKKIFGYYFYGNMPDLKKFAKKRLLAMLFAPNHLYSYEQLVFKEMYPTIHKFIKEYKDVFQYKDSDELKIDKKDSHTKLSHLCFQFEAKIMIDNIAREFDKLHKGKVPVFTLHDCLLTTSSHAEELKEFMCNKFMELFGVAPNLTVEKSRYDTDYCDAC